MGGSFHSNVSLPEGMKYTLDVYWCVLVIDYLLAGESPILRKMDRFAWWVTTVYPKNLLQSWAACLPIFPSVLYGLFMFIRNGK